MGRVQRSSLPRSIATKFKWMTFSFFVGFGLAGCAGDATTEEPVAAEQGAAVEDADAGEGVAAETTDPAMEATDPVADAEDMGDDVAEADASVMTDPADVSAPPELMDAASDAVDAELTTGGDEPSMPAADATPVEDPMSAPAEESGMLAGSEPTPEDLAPMEVPSMDSIPVGQVTSPGVAANLPSVASSASNSAPMAQDYSSSEQATYVVKSGDTLGRIASEIYGTHRDWQAIASANGLNAPYTIYPGDELRFPLTNDHSRSFASQLDQSRKTVVVQKGDTLSALAHRIFGSNASWKVFLAYNKDKIANPNRIAAGMTLAYVDTGVGHAQAAEAPKAKKAAIVAQPKAEPVVPAAAPAPAMDDGPVAPEAAEGNGMMPEETTDDGAADVDADIGE